MAISKSNIDIINSLSYSSKSEDDESKVGFENLFDLYNPTNNATLEVNNSVQKPQKVDDREMYRRSSILVDHISNQFMNKDKKRPNINFLKDKVIDISKNTVKKEFMSNVKKLCKICMELVKSLNKEILLKKFVKFINNELEELRNDNDDYYEEYEFLKD